MTQSDDTHAHPTLRGAAFRYRLGAFIYDALVVAAVWVFTIVLLVTVTGDAVLGPWIQSLLFIEWYAFFGYFWTHRGQTIGMLAWRLRIQSPVPFNHWQALLRFLGALVSFIPALGIGFIWVFFDRANRSWSDMASGSMIVRIEPA